MTAFLGRREFITLFGGVGAAWPLAARAQQPNKMARVGYIRAGTANNDPYREAFVRGMGDLGYVEGRNIAVEFRYYGDDIGSIASSDWRIEWLTSAVAWRKPATSRADSAGVV